MDSNLTKASGGMSALMESLTSLSKLKLPGPQLTSLVEVLWNVRGYYAFEEDLNRTTVILTRLLSPSLMSNSPQKF